MDFTSETLAAWRRLRASADFRNACLDARPDCEHPECEAHRADRRVLRDQLALRPWDVTPADFLLGLYPSDPRHWEWKARYRAALELAKRLNEAAGLGPLEKPPPGYAPTPRRRAGGRRGRPH